MHCLSKQYKYVISADRGFGNQRCLRLCKAVGFHYLSRVEPNMIIQHENKRGIAKEVVNADGRYAVRLIHWGLTETIYRHTKNGMHWYLLSNIEGLSHEDSAKIYANRFKIEKCFQDLKSSGFNKKKKKIRKYSRYKRLLAICMLSHASLVLLGNTIVTKLPAFLKNSSQMGEIVLSLFSIGRKSCTLFSKAMINRIIEQMVPTQFYGVVSPQRGLFFLLLFLIKFTRSKNR